MGITPPPQNQLCWLAYGQNKQNPDQGVEMRKIAVNINSSKPSDCKLLEGSQVVHEDCNESNLNVVMMIMLLLIMMLLVVITIMMVMMMMMLLLVLIIKTMMLCILSNYQYIYQSHLIWETNSKLKTTWMKSDGVRFLGKLKCQGL